MALIVRCTSAWRCTCGVRGRVVFSASGLQRVALCCSLRLGAVWCDAGGDTGSSGSGAKHPTPQSAGPPQKRPEAHLSEPCFHFARVRNAFGFVFFISDCCAQDCESEKPWRSPHRSKHTRVYLQARACVQVYLTVRSRDFDPEVSFCLGLRACLGDLQKGYSNSSSSVYIFIWGLQGH